ncbi:hypothetical protein BKA62DRAFT_778469, partial [Auriculariales sp. MPI-PUGE-AT-0066]
KRPAQVSRDLPARSSGSAANGTTTAKPIRLSIEVLPTNLTPKERRELAALPKPSFINRPSFAPLVEANAKLTRSRPPPVSRSIPAAVPSRKTREVSQLLQNPPLASALPPASPRSPLTPNPFHTPEQSPSGVPLPQSPSVFRSAVASTYPGTSSTNSETDSSHEYNHAKPTDKSAPHFKGEGPMLTAFIENLKALMDKATLDNYQRALRLPNYCNNEVSTDIRQFSQYKADPAKFDKALNGWDVLIARLYKDYPDAKCTVLYKRSDYNEFVSKSKSRAINGKDELGSLPRIHTLLRPSHGPEPHRVDRCCHKLLPDPATVAGNNLALSLSFKEVADASYKFNIDTVTAAAEAIFEKRSTQTGVAWFFNRRRALRVADGSPRQKLPQQLRPGFRERKNVATTSTTTTQTTRGAAATIDCYYCSGAHRMPECAALRQDEADGKCKCDSCNHVVHPDGSRINRPLNAPMKPYIDDWVAANPRLYEELHAQCGKPLTTESAHWYGVQDEYFEDKTLPQSTAAFMTADNTESHWRSFVLDNTISMAQLNHAKAPEKSLEEPRPATPLPQCKETEAPAVKEKPILPRRPVPEEPHIEVAGTRRIIPASAAVAHKPRFRLQPPSVGEDFVQGLANKTLDGPVTLTFRELLSASPELQKYWRIATTPRRIDIGTGNTTNLVEVGERKERMYRYEIEGGVPPNTLIAGDKAMPIRYITCKMGDFDLLLGKPFFALAHAIERHDSDGGSTVALHDPNSDGTVEIPTRSRSRLAPLLFGRALMLSSEN